MQGWIADGYCDNINNNEACTFDGGVVALLIHIIVQYANALKEEKGVAEELQHLPELQLPELAIRVGLLMVIVMISTTI